jgi:hypothetical protein
MKEYRTVKLWISTYRTLKVLAAQSGETLAALVDRLANDEEQRRTKSQ